MAGRDIRDKKKPRNSLCENLNVAAAAQKGQIVHAPESPLAEGS